MILGRVIKKYLFFVTISFFLVSVLGSCKSHKKNIRDEGPFITNEVPHKKKKKTPENSVGNKIAEEAKTWIGTPYGYGRCEKGIATDCSGLVIVVYEEVAAIKMPRNSSQQADFCDDLKEKDIRPGDLVFFATGKDKKKVSHVGVMIDKEKFVHASASKGVIMSEMTTPYYQRTFIKYGRALGK